MSSPIIIELTMNDDFEDDKTLVNIDNFILLHDGKWVDISNLKYDCPITKETPEEIRKLIDAEIIRVARLEAIGRIEARLEFDHFGIKKELDRIGCPDE